jgi:type IV secretory pathway VirB2 component (pilin)
MSGYQQPHTSSSTCPLPDAALNKELPLEQACYHVTGPVASWIGVVGIVMQVVRSCEENEADTG